MKTTGFLTGLLLLLVSSVLAHPPKDVEAKAVQGQLDVTVLHETPVPQAHFIKRVVITLNGSKVMDQQFREQQTKDLQKTTLYFPALKRSDKVTVEAFCSQYGSLKKDVKLG